MQTCPVRTANMLEWRADHLLRIVDPLTTGAAAGHAEPRSPTLLAILAVLSVLLLLLLPDSSRFGAGRSTVMVIVLQSSVSRPADVAFPDALAPAKPHGSAKTRLMNCICGASHVSACGVAACGGERLRCKRVLCAAGILSPPAPPIPLRRRRGVAAVRRSGKARVELRCASAPVFAL